MNPSIVLVSGCFVCCGLVWMVDGRDAYPTIDYQAQLNQSMQQLEDLQAVSKGMDEIMAIMETGEPMTPEQYEQAKKTIDQARAAGMLEGDAKEAMEGIDQYFAMRGRGAERDLNATLTVMQRGEKLSKEEYERGIEAVDDLEAAGMPVEDMRKGIQNYYDHYDIMRAGGSGQSGLVPLAVALCAMAMAWTRCDW